VGPGFSPDVWAEAQTHMEENPAGSNVHLLIGIFAEIP
jgi:hypothetical protein